MLKNMKISARLIVGFLIAVLISSCAGVAGLFLLKTTDESYSAALVDYGFAQGDIGNLGRAFQSQRTTVLYSATAVNAVSKAEYAQTLIADEAKIDTYMLAVKGALGSELGQKMYANLESVLAKYRATRDATISKMVMGETDANITLVRNECAEVTKELSGILDTMISDKSRIGTEKSVQLTKTSELLMLIMFSILVAGFIVSMLIAIYIARTISKPIRIVEQAANELAQGNYDITVDYKAKDEIGALCVSMGTMISTTKSVINDIVRSLGEMADGNFDLTAEAEYVGVYDRILKAMDKITADLSYTMTQINQSSEQVSGGSDQVSSGAQALSQGATEQASSIEELSATIAEISEQIKKNAGNAQEARKKSISASDEVVASNRKMQDMIGAMADISGKSAEISKIIKTIEDIAFQTNILALNAAVEAARAGAAGKGFAVVADEVRNLAGKSAEAAKSTTALIEETVKAVENGTHIADDTANALALVVTGTQEVTELIGNIADASSEQATSVTQVTLGVDQISSVVQTNSATAEESAASSEELSGQAAMLKSLVSKFRVKNVAGMIMPQISNKRADAFMQNAAFEEDFTSSKY